MKVKDLPEFLLIKIQILLTLSANTIPRHSVVMEIAPVKPTRIAVSSTCFQRHNSSVRPRNKFWTTWKKKDNVKINLTKKKKRYKKL